MEQWVLHGAGHAWTALVLPTCNSQVMQFHLDEIATFSTKAVFERDRNRR